MATAKVVRVGSRKFPVQDLTLGAREGREGTVRDGGVR